VREIRKQAKESSAKDDKSKAKKKSKCVIL